MTPLPAVRGDPAPGAAAGASKAATGTRRSTLSGRVAAGELSLRLPPPDLADVMVRIGESFIWREFITGEEPDLVTATEVARVLLS